MLLQSIAENNFLYDALKTVTVDATFPETDVARQFATVAKMMKTKDTRGVDRDGKQ